MVGFAAVMFIIGALTTTTWAFATARATAARLEPETPPRAKANACPHPLSLPRFAATGVSGWHRI